MAQVELGALSSLLARDLSEIPDPPSFKTPPVGTYQWVIDSIQTKGLGKDNKPAIVCGYIITQIIEQTEQDIAPEDQVKPGDKFGESFFFGDPDRADETVSWMKARFAGLAEACGTTDLLQIIEKAGGMEVRGIIKHRIDKNDTTKIYPQISHVVPAS